MVKYKKMTEEERKAEAPRDRDLIKEKLKRRIYAKWMPEMLKRRDEAACPKCGAARENWVARGSGFNKHWLCDICGLSVYKKDLVRGNVYFDWIYYLGRQENKRIKRARKNRMIKTYEKDNI